ncbi:hypothetical protein IF2G_04849 [Cordyceps javanica]|nr:hypothetical protein IF2G_04849 [Cordyceps javanica]
MSQPRDSPDQLATSLPEALRMMCSTRSALEWICRALDHDWLCHPELCMSLIQIIHDSSPKWRAAIHQRSYGSCQRMLLINSPSLTLYRRRLPEQYP